MSVTTSAGRGKPRMVPESTLREAEDTLSTGFGLWPRDGEVHGHAGALAGCAFRGDGSAVGFDQGLNDGQAQAETACSAGPRGIAAIEAVEDPGQIAGGD